MQTEQKTYSISEVAKMFNLSTSTLRYYDQEGIIPGLQKNRSGVREFSSKNLQTLNLINCLKCAGMSIKDIKTFLNWCEMGDETLSKRLKMFEDLRQDTIRQMKELEKTLATLEYKCDYYKRAVEAKSKNSVGSCETIKKR